MIPDDVPSLGRTARLLAIARRLERGPATRSELLAFSGSMRTFRRDLSLLGEIGEPVFYDRDRRIYRAFK